MRSAEINICRLTDNDYQYIHILNEIAAYNSSYENFKAMGVLCLIFSIVALTIAVIFLVLDRKSTTKRFSYIMAAIAILLCSGVFYAFQVAIPKIEKNTEITLAKKWPLTQPEANILAACTVNSQWSLRKVEMDGAIVLEKAKPGNLSTVEAK